MKDERVLFTPDGVKREKNTAPVGKASYYDDFGDGRLAIGLFALIVLGLFLFLYFVGFTTDPSPPPPPIG